MPLIKYNNQSLSSITALPSAIPTGKLKLISSQTASNSASISFTTGLDSTYKVYKFVFSNIVNATDGVSFKFNLSTDSGSNYNVTKTSTMFYVANQESDASQQFGYDTGRDLAQSTSDAWISSDCDNQSDSSLNGSLTLFNPASTTYVKHWISVVNEVGDGGTNYSWGNYGAGYGNTTSAINAIKFNFASGNISAGKIYLYAIDNS